MILRCAIVDDEPLALGLLESYVNKTPFLQLTGKYSSAVQAMKELPGEEVDLLFLDIQMPELNGLEFSWFELVQKPEEIDSIFVKSDYKLVQVELKKIMYIEGLKDYIKIYTEDDAKPILSLMSMKAMEELLPSSRFIRVHRSFIVQKDKIRVIDRGRIVFDKTYIPISDSYKQVFQAFLDERS